MALSISELKRNFLELQKIIRLKDAEIEAMKCCGNCDYFLPHSGNKGHCRDCVYADRGDEKNWKPKR